MEYNINIDFKLSPKLTAITGSICENRRMNLLSPIAKPPESITL